jgi:hypothetical protein
MWEERDDRWGLAVGEIDMEEGVGQVQEKRAERRSWAGATREVAYKRARE